MAHLRINEENGSESIVRLGSGLLRAGRSLSNDLRMEDPAASREHFEVSWDAGAHVIQDLKSRNGTLVNGETLTKAVTLRQGDEIMVGRTRLVYHADDPADEEVYHQSSGTVMFQADELSLSVLEEAASGTDHRARSNVVLLNEVARSLMAMSDEATLNETLVGWMLEVFGADRGAVVYRAKEETTDIVVKAVACSSPAHSREVRISSTAARHVIEEKMSLLITDVLSDERFKAQQSIVLGSITSIMCAPLWHGDTVFGLLYVDTTGRIGVIRKEHLSLLSAIANLAAIKLDNLRLFAESMAMARMERELAVAAEIQTKMLPRASLSFPGLSGVGFNEPCYEVGGDYFDFIVVNETVCSVTVADVSGKGASAAILMASCKSMLTALVDAGVPLIDRMIKLNRYVRENSTPNKFVTFFHAEIDCSTSTLRYSNAGHNPPIVIAQDAAPVLLTPTGPVLGLIEFEYTVEQLEFAPGAVLVAFSDGVTEAVNADNEEYGEERLMGLITGLGHLPPDELRDAILKDVENFCGGVQARDDVTLVIVNREHDAA